jgi:ABC-type transport system substrate-binding protein
MITNRKLVALVDPVTNEYQIDWERSSLVSGMMPATFTIAEDNRTYDLTGQAGPLMEILQILKANGIALNKMVDLRSNPAVRQQVQAVIRRAAATQQASAGPAAPPPTSPPPPSAPVAAPPELSTAQRLQQLETLRATGAISDQEYNTKRQQILSDL